MKKILIVFGTRPEAIKMSPIYLELKKHHLFFETEICVTGQHREMLDQVLSFFNIKPDYDLNIMKPNQSLAEISSNILLGMEKVFSDFKPDFVLVHGDTTTTLAVSLAAFYNKVKICHVEAGLRTFNLGSPWPEEMNRQVTDKIADIHFAPTENSRDNLLKDNIVSDRIYVTGNTVIDALLLAKSKIEKDYYLNNKIQNNLNNLGYQINDNKIILVTGHRRENFGDGFINICQAIKKIADINPNVDIVYPVHLNQNVQTPVFDLLSGLRNVYLIKPLEYMNFIYLLDKSYIVLTDSGGLQEEAPALGKPVLVMRDETERPEAVLAGTAKLVGTSVDKIVTNINLLLNDKQAYRDMSKAHNPYGNGESSKKIVQVFFDKLGIK